MYPEHKPITRTAGYAAACLNYWLRVFHDYWPKRHTDFLCSGPHAHFRCELREATSSIRFWRARLAERLQDSQ
jgi:hypothetical protein